MRTLVAVVAATLAVAACDRSTSEVEGTLPVGHVAISRLPEQPVHHDERPLEVARESADRGDPASVATALVRAGLTREGLEVVELGFEIVATSPRAATVRVAASHRSEMPAPSYMSVYELDLVRGPGGPWRLAKLRQSQ